jgi:hypothetical protein
LDKLLDPAVDPFSRGVAETMAEARHHVRPVLLERICLIQKGGRGDEKEPFVDLFGSTSCY